MLRLHIEIIYIYIYNRANEVQMRANVGGRNLPRIVKSTVTFRKNHKRERNDGHTPTEIINDN